MAAEPEFLPLVTAALGGSPLPDGWRLNTRWHAGQGWIVGRHGAGLPSQGWKLHVSSGVADATLVLRRSIGVLAKFRATFKVVASLNGLRFLNAARAGPSQIGKFITVYPSDDAHAVELARALAEATRGLRGPAVPSDRPLEAGSLVHYRYGAFVGGSDIQTRIGEVVSAIRDGRGALVPDRRGQVYVAPGWVADPFLTAGVAQPLPEVGPMAQGRYVVLGSLYRSYSTTVELAIDLREMRRCVLKRARVGSLTDVDGRDGTDHLRREAALLDRLAGHAAIPTVFDLFAEAGEAVLVLEDFEGETLEQHVSALNNTGQWLPEERVRRWVGDLAAVLEAVHTSGLVHGDVKPGNVVVSPDGTIRLIDFNAASDIVTHTDSDAVAARVGTPGYMSPQQAAGMPAQPGDDVYGLGAVLYFLATGAQPPQTAPPLGGVLSRPIELLSPTRSRSLAEVIEGCLATDPMDRPASMAAVRAALRVGPHEPSPAPAQANGESWTDMAYRVANALWKDAVDVPGGAGKAWISTHPSSRGLRSRDLGMGGAGALLAMAEFADAFGDNHIREVVAEAAGWLVAAPRPGGDPLPGLYVGEAGIGAALLRAGQVLGMAELVDAALARGRFVASLPHSSPDLYNGTAGRLLLHLLLFDATGEPECLRHAVEAGLALSKRADDGVGDTCHWPIPDGYGDMSGRSYLGYAHGAAGIAGTLIDLTEATGDERWIGNIRGAARWLTKQAEKVLADGTGLGWPAQPGVKTSAPFWCHGATGVGQFLLHAHRSGLVPDVLDTAHRAALAAMHSARWAGPTVCHGLAGNVEFLLDIFQQTGEADYLAGARILARLLTAFSLNRGDSLVWCTESNGLITPDYLVGYSGIGMTLLQLAQPDLRPRQLSRIGFTYRKESPHGRSSPAATARSAGRH